MSVCIYCGTSSPLISETIGICLTCLRTGSEGMIDHILEIHRKSRVPFDLPAFPPRDPKGITCNLCANACKIAEGSVGYCGIRSVTGGKIRGGTKEANVDWYYDSLPTNCVADWVCPGGTGIGYPHYAYREGPEHCYKTLLFSIMAALSTVYIARIGTSERGLVKGIECLYLSLPAP